MQDSSLDNSERLSRDPAARVAALESVLIAKGYVDPQALDAIIDTYQNKVGPRYGAKVIARAWSEPEFKAWLLSDATAAIGSMGYTGRQGEHMTVLENTTEVHNMVVCTLCSCYPWAVLGLPPVWYKSPAYRSKAVIDPIGVLKDFGQALSSSARIKVWDSTAEMRYLVLPMQPEASKGLKGEALEAWVTRDSMIGTGFAQAPSVPKEQPQAKTDGAGEAR
jgi:nitrile hydratase subunit alpha